MGEINIYLKIAKEAARLVDQERLTYPEAIKKAKKKFEVELKKRDGTKPPK